MEHRDPVSVDTLLAAVAVTRPADLGAARLREARARLLAALAHGRGRGVGTPEAARHAWVDVDDPVPGARTGLVVPHIGLRAHDRPVSLDDAATACDLCDRVAVALARSLRGHAPRERARALALVGGAAAAGAWLRRADAPTLRRTVAGALRACPAMPHGDAALSDAAVDALDAAPDGTDADAALDALVPGAAARVPADPGALDARPWFRTYPGPLAAGTALEALATVLQRHLRAADKRLRADQVERIDVHLAWPAWEELRDDPALPALLGTLVATHALDAGWRDRPADGADAVAQRVVVRHDWRLSARLRPATATAGAAALRLALAEVWRTRAVPPLLAGDLRDLAGAAAPWRRGGVAGGAASPPAQGPWTNPARVELWTTRGGRWPVLLDVPALPGAMDAARARHPDADALLSVDGGTEARSWAQAVLA
ncbi:MAG: hypothetical protein RLZZ299_19 [Pseudomonadota bacterium]